MCKPYAVGIDPGLTGAIVALDSKGRIAGWHDMPVLDPQPGRKMRQIDLYKLRAIIRKLHRRGVQVWAIEAPQFVGAAPFSQASLNRQFGILVGLALGVSSRVATPTTRTWRREVFGAAKLSKAIICARCADQWPHLPLRSSKLAKTDNMHGRAEAAFIAQYARIQSAEVQT